jgi:hypothetical protein
MELTLNEINKFAEPEGWSVFESIRSLDGNYQIQRLDGKNLFRNDSEAIKHVVKLSLSGSNFHKQALKKVIELNSKESDFIIKSILI